MTHVVPINGLGLGTNIPAFALVALSLSFAVLCNAYRQFTCHCHFLYLFVVKFTLLFLCVCLFLYLFVLVVCMMSAVRLCVSTACWHVTLAMAIP